MKNINLILKISLMSLFITVALISASAADLPADNAGRTTTLIRKIHNGDTLQTWAAGYAANHQFTASPAKEIGGFKVLPFLSLEDGTQRGGLAVDFGRYFLISTSTNLNISDEQLLADGRDAFEKNLKSEAIAMERNLGGCECTDYAHDLVPTLPHGLFTLEDKKGRSITYFRRATAGK